MYQEQEFQIYKWLYHITVVHLLLLKTNIPWDNMIGLSLLCCGLNSVIALTMPDKNSITYMAFLVLGAHCVAKVDQEFTV